MRGSWIDGAGPEPAGAAPAMPLDRKRTRMNTTSSMRLTTLPPCRRLRLGRRRSRNGVPDGTQRPAGLRLLGVRHLGPLGHRVEGRDADDLVRGLVLVAAHAGFLALGAHVGSPAIARPGGQYVVQPGPVAHLALDAVLRVVVAPLLPGEVHVTRV